MLTPAYRPAAPVASRVGDDRVPADPRSVLTSIGVAVYDWDRATDRLVWTGNAAEVLGIGDVASIGSGRDFGRYVEPGSGPTREDAVASADGRDEGSGVRYATAYTLRTDAGRVLMIEDSGRWYAGADGTPATAHGTLRVLGAQDESRGPGQRERAAFLTRLEEDVADAVRRKRPVTVFLVCVDNLSEVNDRVGFEAGDAVIREILDRLHGVMRRRDGFARIGGNRFALALRGCTPEQALIAAGRFTAASSGPVATPKGSVEVHLLIGAATAPDHAVEAAGLFRRAEQSLAIAKRRVGASFVIYDPQIFRSHERPSASGSGLDVVELLNKRRVVFALQPVVEAQGRLPAFHEALLRVDGGDGRIACAADVVPAMERSGLVPLVDMRILELAASRLATHPDERISVNVSPLTLDSPDWLATLAAHVGQKPDIASRLIIEVTETIAIRDPDAARQKLDAMKALGVTLAVDDFGSGHTSFKHLRNFPIDMVKIDGAFVQNLPRSANDQFFVRTLIDLAHHLGLSTVAEWVEDEETAAMLAGWGVDYLQGDYCGMPVLPVATNTVVLPRIA